MKHRYQVEDSQAAVDAAGIAEIEERLSKATLGPWYDGAMQTREKGRNPHTQNAVFSSDGPDANVICATEEAEPQDSMNMDFIAHAPEDMAYLIKELGITERVAKVNLGKMLKAWAALKKYGGHLDNCPWGRNEHNEISCTCGWDVLNSKIPEKEDEDA